MALFKEMPAQSLACLALGLGCLASGCGSETTGPASGEPVDPPALIRFLASCAVPGVGGETLCGRYEVYENREAQSGRTLILEVLVAKATGPLLDPEPVIYFQGGPGGSSVAAAPGIAEILAGTRQGRDLVFIDQRGTGNSNVLSCASLPSGEMSLFGTLFPDDHVDACASKLAAIADLERYSTNVAVDDIAEALTWLGYDQVNLFGASYGTRVALVFLRRHEERVRSVLLNGVAPPHRNIHLHDARNADAALEWLFNDCAEDPTCSSTYPAFRVDFAALVARLDDGPVSVVAPLSDGSTATVDFSRGDFGYAIRGMLYGTLADSIAPWVRESLATGDWAGFPGYYVARSRWVASSFATGMHLSVLCTEDIPFTTEADIQALTSGTLLGESLIRRYQSACDRWPRGSVPTGYREVVNSDKPTLIISGERDPVTPPVWGEETAQGLSRSLHLVVPDAGHVPLDACIQLIQNTFLVLGNPAAVPTNCIGS